MKKKLVSIIFGGTIFAVTPGSTEAVSLIEALIAAFKNSKEWAAKKTEKDAAAERYKQSVMAFLPDISARVSASRERTDRKDYKTDFFGLNPPHFERENMESTTSTFGVQINQNIFSGLSTTNTMKSSKYGKTAAVYAFKNEEQKLVLEVINSYMEIWLCRKTLDALKKMVQNLKNILKAQQSSLEAGMATPADVAEAESKYQGAIYSMIDAETKLMTAVAEFERLTELKADEDMLVPEFMFELPKTAKFLITQATKNNSGILAEKLREQAALKNLDAVRGRLAPSVDASLSFSRELSKYMYADKSKATDNRAGRYHRREEDPKRYNATLTVTIPIFSNQNGSNTYSQIELANQEALKARFTAEEAVLKVKRDCIINWNKYQSAVAMIQASRAAVKSAELSSEGNAEATAVGMKSNTDIWAKENNLLEVRINLAKSQKERIMAAVTILSLIGELSLKTFVMNMRNYSRQQKLNRARYLGIPAVQSHVAAPTSSKITPIKPLKRARRIISVRAA